jgi:hypothetical protein
MENLKWPSILLRALQQILWILDCAWRIVDSGRQIIGKSGSFGMHKAFFFFFFFFFLCPIPKSLERRISNDTTFQLFLLYANLLSIYGS